MPQPRSRAISSALGGFATAGTLTTALAGTNNDLKYTAHSKHANSNNIRVRYVVAGASTPLTVAVSGTDITVNVATNGSSAATSTSAQVKTAVEASSAATALVSVEHAAGNDGTGVVTALAYTALTGGASIVVSSSVPLGFQRARTIRYG